MSGPLLVAPSPVPFSADDMVEAVYRNLDAIQVDESGNKVYDGMWSAEEILQWINEESTYLFQRFPWDGDWEKSIKYSFTAGQASYHLPADMLKAGTVERKVNELWYPLTYSRSPYEVRDRDAATGLTPTFPTYYFEGRSIVFNPAPAEAEYDAIRLNYIRVPDPIGAGNQKASQSFVWIFHWMPILHATICALQKDRADYKPWQERLMKMEMAFKEFLDMRGSDPMFVRSFEELPLDGFYWG